MTDLTVLISPTPLDGPITRNRNPFSFRRSAPCLITPVMVTLETERELDDSRLDVGVGTLIVDEKRQEEESKSPEEEVADAWFGQSQFESSRRGQPPPLGSSQGQNPRRGRSASRAVDPNFLSPPINTWKSSASFTPPPISAPSSSSLFAFPSVSLSSSDGDSSQTRRSGHKHTRSRSAPPVSRTATPTSASLLEEQGQLPFPILPPIAINRPPQRRSWTSFYEGSVPHKRNTSDLLPPPPPLLRPTTFWRKTRKSGVTAASYSPSYHLIRRSTFVAAGLDLETPSHDLRAFSVENRVGFIVVPPEYSVL